MVSPKSTYTKPAELKDVPSEPVTMVVLSGVWHFISAACCLILGIAAIPMMAFYSYYATPIWGSLLIFTTAGVLAMYAHRDYQVNLAFFILCVASSCLALSFIFMYAFAAAYEEYYYCRPGNYWLYYCGKSLEGRRAIDSLIVIFSNVELGASLFGIYVAVVYNRMHKKMISTVSGGPQPVMVQA